MGFEPGLFVRPPLRLAWIEPRTRIGLCRCPATSHEIDQHAKVDERVTLLCQIRGVGRYTAMLIIAEIGDIRRFPTARHLCAWAGLTPTVRSSDGKARLGHITRQGSPALRWALVEAAQKTTSGGGPLREQYERIAKRRGAKIAKVASRARSSPSATTACATERSVAWNPAAGEPHESLGHRMTRRRARSRPRGLRPRLARAHARPSSSFVWPRHPNDGRPLD